MLVCHLECMCICISSNDKMFESQHLLHVYVSTSMLLCSLECVCTCISSNDKKSESQYLLHVYVSTREWRQHWVPACWLSTNMISLFSGGQCRANVSPLSVGARTWRQQSLHTIHINDLLQSVSMDVMWVTITNGSVGLLCCISLYCM